MQNKNVLLHNEHGNGDNECAAYRKTLGALGIEKKEGEKFSDCELRQIFVSMQEDLLGL